MHCEEHITCGQICTFPPIVTELSFFFSLQKWLNSSRDLNSPHRNSLKPFSIANNWAEIEWRWFLQMWGTVLWGSTHQLTVLSPRFAKPLPSSPAGISWAAPLFFQTGMLLGKDIIRGEPSPGQGLATDAGMVHMGPRPGFLWWSMGYKMKTHLPYTIRLSWSPGDTQDIHKSAQKSWWYHDNSMFLTGSDPLGVQGMLWAFLSASPQRTTSQRNVPVSKTSQEWDCWLSRPCL